jgi:hypothetical protein
MVGTKPAPREAVTPTKPAPREAVPPTKPALREPAAAVGQKPLRKPERVSNREAAVMLGVEERTLADWRRRKVGPEYERLANGHVAYYRHQILDFKQRWEAAPEITGHQGKSRYTQLKLENDQLKADNERLKRHERLHGVRFTEEVKAIVAENLAMKAELALRNKIVHALYESEPQLRARYQDEAEAGHFASIDSSFVPTEDLRRRLVALYSGTLHGKLQKIK